MNLFWKYTRDDLCFVRGGFNAVKYICNLKTGIDREEKLIPCELLLS